LSYYIHDIPGRLRIKSPAIKKNQSTAERVRRMLSGMDGVHDVNINLTTGSLLVNYDTGQLENNRIVQALQEQGYFEHSRAVTNDQYFQNVSAKFLNLLTAFV